MNNEEEIIKDNTVVMYFPDITSEEEYRFFTNPFLNNGVALPFTTYVDGVSIGDNNCAQLTLGPHTIEIKFEGTIEGLQDPFKSWDTPYSPVDIDFSRMDFSNANWNNNTSFMIGVPYLRNLNMSNLVLNGQIVMMQCGVATDPATNSWTFKNTKINNFSDPNYGISGGINTNYLPEDVNFDGFIGNVPYDEAYYPVIWAGPGYTKHLDLSKAKFAPRCTFNFNGFIYIESLYLNVDPTTLYWESPAAPDGNDLYEQNGIRPILYVNSSFVSNSLWAENFPNWTIRSFEGAVPDTTWTLKSLEWVQLPTDIAWDVTSINYSYKIIYENGLGDTRFDMMTGSYTTTVNTSENVIPITISVTYSGMTIHHSVNHYPKPSLNLDRKDVIAGDIVVTDSSGNIGFVRNSIPTGWTPEGVVIIPPSHNIYSNNKGLMISLKHMPLIENGSNWSHSGSSNYHPTPLWPGAFRVNLENNTMYAYGTVNSQSDSYTTATDDSFINNNMFAFPSDLYAGVSGAIVCKDDSNSYYMANGSANASPSPYLSDGTRNPKYRAQSDNFLDIRGSYRTGQKVAHGGTAHDTYNGEAAAAACNLYNSGTNFTWYLPDLGELGYLAARLKAVRNAFAKLYSWGYTWVPDLINGYNIVDTSGQSMSCTGIISCNYSTWRTDYHARYFNWSNGTIGHIRYNAYKAPVHAVAWC